MEPDKIIKDFTSQNQRGFEKNIVGKCNKILLKKKITDSESEIEAALFF